MADRAGLERLLRELRATASPVQRVKMLGRAWRSLRGFDRAQLQELARRAGLEQAEGYLERLAQDKGRLTPSMLLQIMQRFKHVEPAEVDEVIRGLRDPDRRKELLREGLDVVDDLLDEPAEKEEEKEEQDEATAAPVPVEVEFEPARTPTPIEREPETEPEPPTISETPPPVEAEKVAIPSPPAPPLSTRPRQAPRPVPVVVPPPPSRGETVPRPRVTPAAPAAPPRGSAGRDSGELLGRLTGEPSIIDRLRILRRELPEIDAGDVENLRRLLEAFPDGWARRRALDAMLRAGRPATLMHAVYLIEQLDSPTAQRWCAGTLLDSRSLTANERQALIERHRIFPHRRL